MSANVVSAVCAASPLLPWPSASLLKLRLSGVLRCLLFCRDKPGRRETKVRGHPTTPNQLSPACAQLDQHEAPLLHPSRGERHPAITGIGPVVNGSTPNEWKSRVRCAAPRDFDVHPDFGVDESLRQAGALPPPPPPPPAGPKVNIPAWVFCMSWCDLTLGFRVTRRPTTSRSRSRTKASSS